MVPEKLDTIFPTWIISLFFSLSLNALKLSSFALKLWCVLQMGGGEPFIGNMVEGLVASKI
ncbi:hypothetical protein ACS0TY_008070 [Phlomoides rotata]